ncbi:MAG: hypothetical protein IPL24_09565 [Bacteroidetes bacterium]|nr:hypothetical protein [Bacteroidota bacterium]
MTENTTRPASRKIDYDTRILINHLVKDKYYFLSISFGIGIIFSIIIKLYVLGYSSTGSFYVNDMNVLSSSNVDLKVVDNLTPSDNFNRIFQQVISTQIQNHLIKKFNLTKHYGVDSTKEFYLQRTGNILKSNISVKKNTFNTILVTVNDEHRYLAAEMVNEIMNYIDEINREYYARTIQQKLKISEAFLTEIKKDNNAKSRSIDSLLAEMHHLTTQGSRPTTSAIYMLQLEQNLGSLINELTNSTHDLMNSQKLYNLALQALNQKSYKTISVVQAAMPAPKSNIYQAVFYGGLITVASMFIIILIVHIRLFYSEHLDLLMGKSNKPE